MPWASCQIRKIAGAHAPGMPGTFSPSPRVSDPDMHHGTCVTHVPWCMPVSLTSGFLWNRWWGKRSRYFWRMRNPQFYVSGKRPMTWLFLLLLSTHMLLMTDAMRLCEDTWTPFGKPVVPLEKRIKEVSLAGSKLSLGATGLQSWLMTSSKVVVPGRDPPLVRQVWESNIFWFKNQILNERLYWCLLGNEVLLLYWRIIS